MMSKQSGDADEPRQQMTGGIPRQGTAQLSGVGNCISDSLNSMRSDTFSQCNCQERRDAVVPTCVVGGRPTAISNWYGR